VQLAYKRCIKGVKDKAELHSHSNKMVSVLVVVFIFLYLVLSRLTLDVFNCSPTDPPDGNLYMSGMLDVVCFESDAHLLLFPFAIGTAIAYVAGLPILSFLFVRHNLYNIKYDQILRARRVHPSSNLFPDTVRRFRERWHRLYYLFRPGKAYWISCIFGRKFLIAFTALVFRTTPSYQMAACILVLFASFTLQVRHTPYMSLGDHAKVYQDFKAYTDEANEKCHGTLQKRVRDDMQDFEAKYLADTKRTSGGRWDAAAGDLLRSGDQDRAAATGLMAEYLVDYTTTEMVLLGCGILVNLSGIMFLSDRFGDSYGDYYQAEHDALAAIVATVIIVSITFFVGTLFVEVLYVVAPDSATRLFGMCVSKKRLNKRKGGKKGRGAAATGAAPGAAIGTDEPDEVLMLNNPFAAAKFGTGEAIRGSQLPDAPPDAQLWTHIKATYVKNERSVASMSRELELVKDKAKREEAMRLAGGAAGSRAAASGGAASVTPLRRVGKKSPGKSKVRRGFGASLSRKAAEDDEDLKLSKRTTRTPMAKFSPAMASQAGDASLLGASAAPESPTTAAADMVGDE